MGGCGFLLLLTAHARAAVHRAAVQKTSVFHVSWSRSVRLQHSKATAQLNSVKSTPPLSTPAVSASPSGGQNVKGWVKEGYGGR